MPKYMWIPHIFLHVLTCLPFFLYAAAISDFLLVTTSLSFACPQLYAFLFDPQLTAFLPVTSSLPFYLSSTVWLSAWPQLSASPQLPAFLPVFSCLTFSLNLAVRLSACAQLNAFLLDPQLSAFRMNVSYLPFFCMPSVVCLSAYTHLFTFLSGFSCLPYRLASAICLSSLPELSAFLSVLSRLPLDLSLPVFLLICYQLATFLPALPICLS
jgi:hypothetical protein